MWDMVETHYHKCPNPKCGHVWKHSMLELMMKDCFTEGHTCRKCGTRQTMKHLPTQQEAIRATADNIPP